MERIIRQEGAEKKQRIEDARRHRRLRLTALMLALAAILTATAYLERMHKADGPTHADKIHLQRLIDSID
ncbi:MAG: hypothetical protein KGI70_02875 [Patescibacteria group bacterium]|nr:hypothetical protein [Patescibacteria group bacterium]